MRISSLLLTVSFAALTAACAVGPDFMRPAAPDSASIDPDAPQTTVAADDKYGAAQNLINGAPLPAAWWKLFQSAPLNDLITEALLHNPDLEAAQATLRVADENLAAGGGALYPTISGSFSSERQKTAGASFGGTGFPGSIYNLHNASVSLSYGLDIFGGTRRAIENLEAQREYEAYELQAARLSLTANVVTTAIKEASLRGQIAATHALIDEQKKQVDISRAQLNAGSVTRLAYLTATTTLSQTKATLPGLEQQLAVTRHALSVLTGKLPSEAPKATFQLDSLHLPEQVPVSLPSQLVEQRPDIRAAEANLHAASAEIGVAEANRLPQFAITADIGSVANQIGKLFSPGGGIWAIGGSLSETIFDGGTLLHEERSAKAQYDVAAAQYRKTVLAAFQDVADTLRALAADAETLQADVDAERDAAESLKLARTQYESGSISYVALLDSENAEQKSRIALVQAEAQRFADTTALFQALGGGWTSNMTNETKE